MFAAEEAGSREPGAAGWPSPAYRLAHLDGLREPQMLYRRIGADQLAPAETRGMALCNLGNPLDDSGRWVEAYTAYADALAADPTNGNAAGNIAELRRRLGRRVDQRGHLAAVYDKYVATARSLRERTSKSPARLPPTGGTPSNRPGAGATCGMTATSSTLTSTGRAGARRVAGELSPARCNVPAPGPVPRQSR
jgi:tetratricopeptide (TPR) repeat protein